MQRTKWAKRRMLGLRRCTQLAGFRLRVVFLTLASVVGAACVGFANPASAATWDVVFDLRPSALDWNSRPTAACGTLFKNTNTPFGAGDFTRCTGGVPVADDRISDGNHLAFTSGNMGAAMVPAWAWNGGSVLRFEDVNGDGVPENGAEVKLVWFSIEQHVRSGAIPLYGGDLRIHMHTRAGWADQQSASNCPASISVMGQPTRLVTCNDGSYGIRELAAVGLWDAANNRVVWSNLDTDSGDGVVYAGQLKRVHNFGYIECTSSSSGCALGAVSPGLNWQEGWTDWQVAQVHGTSRRAEQPLSNFQFVGTVNFLTATSSLYFSTADTLVESSPTGRQHNSWWNLQGRLAAAGMTPESEPAWVVPEPGTGLLLLSGLIGFAAQRRRKVA